MKSKGYIFVETIVIIAVLTLGLVMIYASFSSMIASEKRRASYNDISFIYRTYNLQKYLSTLNIKKYADEFVKGTDTDTGIYKFNCDNASLYQNSTVYEQDQDKNKYGNEIAYCTKFIENVIKAKKIYIVKKVKLPEIKGCIGKNGNWINSTDCKNFNSLIDSSKTRLYFKTIKRGEENNNYMIVVEYTKEVSVDENVSFVNPKDGKCWNESAPINGNCCPNGYTYENNKCIRKISQSYFNNIDLVSR